MFLDVGGISFDERANKLFERGVESIPFCQVIPVPLHNTAMSCNESTKNSVSPYKLWSSDFN